MSFMGTRQAAKLLGVSPGKLQQDLWHGRLVPLPQKGPSGAYLWTALDIERASWQLLGKPLEKGCLIQNEQSPLDQDRQDPLQDFFDDMLIFADTAYVPEGELRASYEDYSKTAGIKSILSLRAFNKRLLARGCITVTKHFWNGLGEPESQWCWVGVTLKTNPNNRFDVQQEDRG